jgi:hypothetical protein
MVTLILHFLSQLNLVILHFGCFQIGRLMKFRIPCWSDVPRHLRLIPPVTLPPIQLIQSAGCWLNRQSRVPELIHFDPDVPCFPPTGWSRSFLDRLIPVVTALTGLFPDSNQRIEFRFVASQKFRLNQRSRCLLVPSTGCQSCTSADPDVPASPDVPPVVYTADPDVTG